MQREIEKKFLVLNDDFMKEQGLSDKLEIVQGYFNKTDGKIVRVRLVRSLIHDSYHGKLTLKIKGVNDNGAGVDEFEYDIPATDAVKLLDNCIKPLIQKTRHVIEYGNAIWEVDVFHGHKEGLTVAEIELDNEHQHFAIPQWIGENVTDKGEYYNANM